MKATRTCARLVVVGDQEVGADVQLAVVFLVEAGRLLDVLVHRVFGDRQAVVLLDPALFLDAWATRGRPRSAGTGTAPRATRSLPGTSRPLASVKMLSMESLAWRLALGARGRQVHASSAGQGALEATDSGRFPRGCSCGCCDGSRLCRARTGEGEQRVLPRVRVAVRPAPSAPDEARLEEEVARQAAARPAARRVRPARGAPTAAVRARAACASASSDCEGWMRQHFARCGTAASPPPRAVAAARVLGHALRLLHVGLQACRGRRSPSHGPRCAPSAGAAGLACADESRALRLARRPPRGSCARPGAWPGDSGETWRIEPSPKNSRRPSTHSGVAGKRNGIALEAIRCSIVSGWNSARRPGRFHGSCRGRAPCGRRSSARRWCSWMP